jgi:hypothetical protein
MKSGVIPIGVLDPVMLAKSAKKVQTVDELFVDEARSFLKQFVEFAKTVIATKDRDEFVNHLDEFEDFQDGMSRLRDQLAQKDEERGFLNIDEYDIVIDRKRNAIIVVSSPYTSKGKFSFSENSIDMAYPSNDGEECFVLGPEWFPERKPTYDIKNAGRRQAGPSHRRRVPRKT